MRGLVLYVKMYSELQNRCIDEEEEGQVIKSSQTNSC